MNEIEVITGNIDSRVRFRILVSEPVTEEDLIKLSKLIYAVAGKASETADTKP